MATDAEVNLSARTERSLAGYLLLPRPGDVGKAVIIPIAFLIGISLTSVPAPHLWLRALVVWLAVEYLTYQARYQWNDIRGFECDQAHPDKHLRGRLPGPLERGRLHIRVSTAVLSARVALALLLPVLLPGLHLTGPLLAGMAGVFGAAVVYEAVRSRCDRAPRSARPAAPCVALWVVSGAGYCVRGLTGLVLGLSGSMVGAGLVAAGGAFWAAGIVFVTCRWAVESLPFAKPAGDRLEWRASAKVGRGHLLALSRWLPHDAAAAPRDLRAWRPLAAPTPWHAPWNLALLVALVLGSVGGAILADGATDAGSAGLLALCVLAGWRVLVDRPQLSTAVVCAAGLIGAAAATGTAAVGVPAAVVTVVYVLCTRQCLAEIGALCNRVLRVAVQSAAR